jgi:hypothetical protein
MIGRITLGGLLAKDFIGKRPPHYEPSLCDRPFVASCLAECLELGGTGLGVVIC